MADTATLPSKMGRSGSGFGHMLGTPFNEELTLKALSAMPDWGTVEEAMQENGLESLSFLPAPKDKGQANDRDAYLTILHLHEDGHASPLDALRRSKSPNRKSGNASPLRGRSVSPLRERLMAKALTAHDDDGNNQSGQKGMPQQVNEQDGINHWRSPPGAVKGEVKDGVPGGVLKPAADSLAMEEEEEEEEELDAIEVGDLISGFIHTGLTEERGRKAER